MGVWGLGSRSPCWKASSTRMCDGDWLRESQGSLAQAGESPASVLGRSGCNEGRGRVAGRRAAWEAGGDEQGENPDHKSGRTQHFCFSFPGHPQTLQTPSQTCPRLVPTACPPVKGNG